ncbi:hypothetical protein CFE70_006242 [Pyrenophora teres f. teres 0-1]
MPAVVGAVRDVTDTEVAEPPTTMKKFIAYEIFGYVRLDAFGSGAQRSEKSHDYRPRQLRENSLWYRIVVTHGQAAEGRSELRLAANGASIGYTRVAGRYQARNTASA